MITTVSQFKSELADRETNRDCLYRYSRGVDRYDEELLRSVYRTIPYWVTIDESGATKTARRCCISRTAIHLFAN